MADRDDDRDDLDEATTSDLDEDPNELDEATTSDLDEDPNEFDEEDEAVMLEAFDLDHDGKVGFIDDARVRLGIIDANLEEHAKEPGIKGAIADVAHRALDKLDND